MIQPGEVVTWLNEFKYKIHGHCEMLDKDPMDDKSSEMSLAADRLYSQLPVLMTAGKTAEAKLVMDRLKIYALHSTNSLERGEVWVCCGMDFYKMKDYPNAADALEYAVAAYPPISHQQAVSRWLLGYMQWNLTSCEDAAISSWSKSIDEFNVLMEQAQNDHQENRKTWYKEKIEILKEALKEQISRRFP